MILDWVGGSRLHGINAGTPMRLLLRGCEEIRDGGWIVYFGPRCRADSPGASSFDRLRMRLRLLGRCPEDSTFMLSLSKHDGRSCNRYAGHEGRYMPGG